MMQQLRKATQGFLAAILFGLLILSFGLWGVGDVFSPSTGLTDDVIKVGDHAVSGQQLVERVNERMRRLQMPSSSVEVQRALRMQVAQQVTQQFVTSALFLEEARDLDVAISDAVLNGAIRSNPQFQGADGEFDQRAYVRAVGGNPAAYEEGTLRPQLGRSQFVDAVLAGAEPPRALLESLHAYRNERRTVDIAHVAADGVGEVDEPSEEELRTYYDEHPDAFTAPEYRKVIVVIADPARLQDEMEVTEQRIEEVYEQRRGQYETPERREIRQVLFGPGQQEQAMNAYRRLQEGESFPSVARDSLSGTADDLGEVRRGGLATPELNRAAFSVGEGEVTEPVQSALGWHVFKVENVAEGSVKPLSEVRDEIVADIRANEAVDLAYRLGEDLDALVGGGATLEQAAEELDLPLVEVPAMDAQGRNREGEPVEGLPEAPAIPEEAFDLQEGEVGFLSETEDRARFILRVDEVIPSAVRPYKEVRDKVRDAWLARARKERAGEIAQQIAAQVREGVTLPAAAERHGLSVRMVEEARRDGENIGPNVSDALLDEIFDAAPGQPVTAGVEGGHTVAVPTDVHQADTGADMSELRAQATDGLHGDLIVQLGEALRQRQGVEIDQETIQRLMQQ